MMHWDDDIFKPIRFGSGQKVEGVRFSFQGNGANGRVVCVRFGADVMRKMRWDHKDRLAFRFSRERREQAFYRVADPTAFGLSINRSTKTTSGVIVFNPKILPDDILPIWTALCTGRAEPEWRDSEDGLIVSMTT